MIDDQIVPEFETIFLSETEMGHFQEALVGARWALAHQRVAVRDRLRELFADRVIALHHKIEWPPRSPDLTPCDFSHFG